MVRVRGTEYDKVCCVCRSVIDGVPPARSKTGFPVCQTCLAKLHDWVRSLVIDEKTVEKVDADVSNAS